MRDAEVAFGNDKATHSVASLVTLQVAFGDDKRGSAPVMKQEPIPIAAEHARDVEYPSIVECLLDACPHGVGIVFRLDDGDGDVWLIIKDIVGPLAFAPCGEFAPHVDFTIGERDFFEELRVLVPASGFEGGGDVLGADVPFGEELFVQGHGGRMIW